MEGFVAEYFDQNPISQVRSHRGSDFWGVKLNRPENLEFDSVHFPILKIRDLWP